MNQETWRDIQTPIRALVSIPNVDELQYSVQGCYNTAPEKITDTDTRATSIQHYKPQVP